MNKFFKKLKELREASPFTQQQIADKLGISIKQYQNYEVKTIPPHDKLMKLNQILQYDLSKLIYEEKVPNLSGKSQNGSTSQKSFSDDNPKIDEILHTITELASHGTILSEANRTIAEANRTIAAANKILSENNKDLVQMVNRISSGGVKGTSSKQYPVSRQTLYQMAQAGIPEHWKSVDEGLIALGKLLIGGRMVKQE